MLKGLSFFFITLVLLPLLSGVYLDIKGCCDPELTAMSETSEVLTPCLSCEGTNGHCPVGGDCHQCCGITCVKVVPLNRIALVQPPFVKIDLSYHYNFSPKSIDLSTPQKPPRV